MRTCVSFVALIFLASVSMSCGGPPAPATGSQGQPSPEKAVAAGEPSAQAQAKAINPTTPPVSDISGEILGTLTLASVDSILNQGATLVRPHLPPAFQPMANPEMLKMRIFASVRAPELQKVIDLSRPAAVAMVDPQAYKGKKLGPILLALPVLDASAFVDFLAKKADGHEATPWKDHLFMFKSETIRLRIDKGYVLLAGHETLISGAAGVLMPLLTKPPQNLADPHINVAAINRLYGEKIDKVIAKSRRKLAKQKLDKINVGKMVTRWMGFIKGMKDFNMSLSLEGDFIKLLANVKAKASGSFTDYLGKLNAGPAWGAKFLPQESALVILTRDSPERIMEDVNDAMDMLEGLLPLADKDPQLKQLAKAIDLKAWRGSVRRAIKHFSGEGAAALWATQDGGLGMGGATRWRDGKAGQVEIRKWMRFLSKELARLQKLKPVRAFIKKELPGFKLSLKIKEKSVRAAGIKGDRYELGIRWPKLKNKKDRKMLDKIKKGVAKVLGRKFTMAYVTVGDTMLWTAGKDYRQRLAAMVPIARGGKGSGMDKTIQPFVAGKKIVGMAYSSVASLMEQSLRVAHKVTTIPAKVKNLLGKVMPGPDKDVPVMGLVHLQGSSVFWEGQISTEVVGMIVRGAMEALTMRSAPPRRPMPPKRAR